MRNVRPDFTEDEKDTIKADVDEVADRTENRLRGLTKLSQPDQD